MPFILPVLGVIAGAWGLNKIINQDDSADEAAAKALKKIPSHIRKHVDRVHYDYNKGWMITFKTGTPQSVIDEATG